MGSRARAVIGVLVCVAAAASPAAAGELWSAPVDGCSVALAFGAHYADKTHRGVDFVADAGADVRSPADGIVAFAGTVPADGGGTCSAVTVELADGLKVSLLPLDGVFVKAGDRVSAAEAVGVLAASGDDSWAASHLHLGTRQGSAYVDPTGFLPVAVAETPEPTGDVVPDVADPAATVAAPPSVVSAPSTQPGASGAPSAPQESAAQAPVGALSEAPRTNVAGSSPTVPRVATAARDTHAIPEDAGVPVPSGILSPSAAGSVWAWSLPTLAAAGATLPTVAAAAAALVALAGPRLRAARANAQ